MKELKWLIEKFSSEFLTILKDNKDFIFTSYSENNSYKLMISYFKNALKEGEIDFGIIREIKSMAKLQNQYDEYMNNGIKVKQKLLNVGLEKCWNILLKIVEHPQKTRRKKFPLSYEALEEMDIILINLQEIGSSNNCVSIDYYEYLFFKSYSLIEKIGIEYGEYLTKNTMLSILKEISIVEFYNDFVRDQFFNVWTKTKNIDNNKVMYFEFESKDKIKILWQEFIPSDVYNSTIYKLIKTQRNEQTHNLNLSTKFADNDFTISKEQLYTFAAISCMLVMYLAIHIKLMEEINE
jgi:hypothetical protein